MTCLQLSLQCPLVNLAKGQYCIYFFLVSFMKALADLLYRPTLSHSSRMLCLSWEDGSLMLTGVVSRPSVLELRSVVL
jgi:hypothetical protein